MNRRPSVTHCAQRLGTLLSQRKTGLFCILFAISPIDAAPPNERLASSFITVESSARITQVISTGLSRLVPNGGKVGQHPNAPGGGDQAATVGTGKLVYGNTLGTHVFGVSGSPAALIADDIVTTAVAGCGLDRYVVRVTSDRLGTGNGVGSPLTVKVGLYATCPGAMDVATPISGTECEVTIVPTEVGQLHDVVCSIAPDINIVLPSTLYVGVSFDNIRAGVVIGAPAELGFSADRFHVPWFTCDASFGGFPDFPHGSFYVQVFARGCDASFPVYRNTQPTGSAFTPGARIRFADDIRLTRDDCNMVAYEVSIKGSRPNCSGTFLVDLKTALDDMDPVAGNRVPGTAKHGALLTSTAQVFRFEVDPPVPVPSSLFVTFETSSGTVGPIVTGRRADIGSTQNTYAVYEGTAPTGAWVFREFGNPIWSAFDVTVFCDGAPPQGACCDMFLTDENDESVCRDVAEINCASSATAPLLWQEGMQCGVTDLGEPALCIGGENDGQPCSRQADCPGSNCSGGTNDGGVCTTHNDCPGAGARCIRASCPGPFFKSCGIAACCLFDDGCVDDTQKGCNAIEPTDEPRLFGRGTYCSIAGQRCPKGACIGREGSCTSQHDARCLFGENEGEVCDPNATQPFPNVTGCHGVCVRSGAQDGASCLRDADCTGLCARAQCEGGSNDGGPCRDDDDCTQGACSLPLCPGLPGCEDPSCCTLICSIDSFCCDRHWDEFCGTEALEFCSFLEPNNDHCSDLSPDKGTQLVNVPDNVDGDTKNSTESSDDPGFCCNGDDPGGLGLGTIWYKFVAPPASAGELFSSVQIQTCQSNNDDSLLQLFALETPNQGVCSDLSLCSVSAQDCSDGSVCDQDPIACAGLIPIGCSDDNDACFSGAFPKPFNSKLCAPDLIPGDTYYFMVAAKTVEAQGIYRIILSSPCTAPPPLPNDLCHNAAPLDGFTVKIDFDLSGTTTGTAPVTFECPGPGCNLPDFPMQSDAWYEWMAPATGLVTVDTCAGFVCVGGDRAGQPCNVDAECPLGSCIPSPLQPETTMVVYEGCGCPAKLFDEIACSASVEEAGCLLGSIVTFDAVEGTCYKIRLGGLLGGAPMGDLKIELTETTILQACCLGNTCSNLPTEDCLAALGDPRGLGCFCQELIDTSGPLVTHPNGGADGASVSALQDKLGLTLLGVEALPPNELADEFVISNPIGEFVEFVRLFAFQSNSGNGSTIQSALVKIWDGPPGEIDSSVILSATTILDTEWTGIYRSQEALLANTQLPIMRIDVAISAQLDAGTYWVSYSLRGDPGLTGPFSPPVSILGEPATGNALVKVDGANWLTLQDNGFPQGVPIEVFTGNIERCCLESGRPQPDVVESKNRYLSFSAGDVGQNQAVRVVFLDLPGAHSALNGMVMWVGEPSEVSGAGGSVIPALGAPCFRAATLECDPYYTSWNAFDIVHVFHEGIVPGGTYTIQVLDESCELEVESGFSFALDVIMSAWGDVVGEFDAGTQSWTEPDGTINVTSDVVAILDGFKSLPGAPRKARTDIEPTLPDQKVNITDVTRALDAFAGQVFPFEVMNPPCALPRVAGN